jgi:hypothetical protein
MRTLLRHLGLTNYPFWVGGIAGLVAGLGIMLVAFPFLFPPPVVDEPEPAADIINGRVIAIHVRCSRARSRARPLGRRVRSLDTNASGLGPGFNGDFRAGPGPNYWIYLNTVQVGEERAFRSDQGRVRIAALKSFRGGQNYLLSSELGPALFHTVTIWCESFGVYIGSAAFQVRLIR